MGNLPSQPPSATVNTSSRDCSEFSNDYCLTDEEYVTEIQFELQPTGLEQCLLALYAFVLLGGLLGNAMVIVAVLRTAHMRTATNLFLLNLAMADFLVLLLCLVPTAAEDVMETWIFGDVGCRILKYMQPISVTVSVLTLTFNSVERLLAICFPLKVRTTKRRMVTAIVLIWTVAAVSKAHFVFKMHTQHFSRLPSDVVLLTQCKSSWLVPNNGSESLSLSADLITSVVDSLLFFVLPFAWMLFAYAMVCRKLWYAHVPGESLAASVHSAAKRANDATLRQRRRTALMLIAIVIIFFVCYLPVHILRALQFYITKRDFFMNNQAMKNAVQYIAIFAHWLCYFNSAVNPVIYSCMSSKFRSEFLHLCHRCCCCCSDVAGGGGGSSNNNNASGFVSTAACNRQRQNSNAVVARRLLQQQQQQQR